MPDLLPIFPLNTVAFPAMTVPLHIFEERYRALVRDLLAVREPRDRLFGIVAIREGWEVGGRGGTSSAQSLYRTGCVVQLVAHEAYPDGRYDIAAVGRHRMRVLATDTSGAYARAEVAHLHPSPVTRDGELEVAQEAARALATFRDYAEVVSRLTGADIVPDGLPRDPELLSYVLAAASSLTLPERQRLLEAATTTERLQVLRRLLVRESGAMRALPSLPATEVARTAWSPN